MARRMLTVRISDEGVRVLDEQAQVLGVTRSEYLRMLVGHAMASKPVLDQVRRAAAERVL